MISDAYAGKILIIDDQSSELELVARRIKRFSSMQLEPICVNCSDRAIKLLQRNDCKLCLCDYWLQGGKTALDFLSDCRGLNITLPVVVITSGGSNTIDEYVMQAGAADFLGKEDIITPVFERTLRHVLIRQNTLTKLINEAAIDPLTRCISRLYFERKLSYDFNRSKLNGEPLCVLAIDLDRLKETNDQHGHEAGDLTLGAVGECFQKTLRGEDYVGRMGGDEFVAVLPGCDSVRGSEVAERLVESIANIELPYEDKVLQPSISVGVAHSVNAITYKDLIKAADNALYDAKKQGGNLRRLSA